MSENTKSRISGEAVYGLLRETFPSFVEKPGIGYDFELSGYQVEAKTATLACNSKGREVKHGSSLRLSQWYQGMTNPNFRWGLFGRYQNGNTAMWLLTHQEFSAHFKAEVIEELNALAEVSHRYGFKSNSQQGNHDIYLKNLPVADYVWEA